MNSNEAIFAVNSRGFTLVELMITLAMSGIIVAAIYSAYIIQQKTYYTQGQVVEMQQNIRAGLEMMASEIRMATYDPGQNAGASITIATSSQFAFTADLNDDGDLADPNEQVTLCLAAVGGGCDVNGVADTGSASLERNGQAIADGIHAIEFYYTLDDGVTKTLTPADTTKIQIVQITMLAVANQRDPKFTDLKTYTTGSGATWGPYGNNFHRRLLTSSVNIRNHGLKK